MVKTFLFGNFLSRTKLISWEHTMDDKIEELFKELKKNSDILVEYAIIATCKKDAERLLVKAKKKNARYAVAAIHVYLDTVKQGGDTVPILRDWETCGVLINCCMDFVDGVVCADYLPAAFLEVQMDVKGQSYTEQVKELLTESNLFNPFYIVKLGVLRDLLDDTVGFKCVWGDCRTALDIIARRD